MSRIAIAIAAIVCAYGVCALSGITRWMHMWLKGFYPSYALVLWLTLSLLIAFLSRARRFQTPSIIDGAMAGYAAGIFAYQIGPAFRDGSFARSMGAMSGDLLGYLLLSLSNPLLYLTPIPGMLTAAAFCAFAQPNRVNRNIAVGTVSTVLVVGWVFFLTRGALPPRW